MKKFFVTFALVCLFAFSGCARDSGKTVAPGVNASEIKIYDEYELTVYPKGIEKRWSISEMEEPPFIVYTKSAEENGLGGEFYKVMGKVTEVMTDKEGDFDKFIVKTVDGEFLVLDGIPSAFGWNGKQTGITKDEVREKFPLPEVDEMVCVYVEYMGLSEELEIPTGFWGGRNYAISELSNMEKEKEEAENADAEEPKTETVELTEAEKIEKSAKLICIENYASTHISSMEVNENLGTEEENDYIVLAYLMWDVKNKAETTKEMLAMYSEDFAARIGNEIPNVSEFTVFWKVPYHSETENVIKYSYTRKDGEMYQTEEMISAILN